MPTFPQTIAILKEAITGTRIGGETPTYMHSVRVGELLKKHGFSEDIQYAGLLHDIVEDGDYTLDQLRELGYSERTVELVDFSTFDLEMGETMESWLKMMERLVEIDDKDAWAVKLADLADNLTECHHCELIHVQGYLFRKAPLFIYYGNKHFSGTEFYSEFLDIYRLQVRRYHKYFQ